MAKVSRRPRPEETRCLCSAFCLVGHSEKKWYEHPEHTLNDRENCALMPVLRRITFFTKPHPHNAVAAGRDIPPVLHRAPGVLVPESRHNSPSERDEEGVFWSAWRGQVQAFRPIQPSSGPGRALCHRCSLSSGEVRNGVHGTQRLERQTIDLFARHRKRLAGKHPPLAGSSLHKPRPTPPPAGTRYGLNCTRAEK